MKSFSKLLMVLTLCAGFLWSCQPQETVLPSYAAKETKNIGIVKGGGDVEVMGPIIEIASIAVGGCTDNAPPGASGLIEWRPITTTVTNVTHQYYNVNGSGLTYKFYDGNGSLVASVTSTTKVNTILLKAGATYTLKVCDAPACGNQSQTHTVVAGHCPPID